VGLSLLLAGCAATAQAAAPVGDPVAGRALYESGGEVGIPCTTCHSLDGSTIVGPTHQGLGQRAASRIEGMSAEDYIRQSILEPSAYVVDGFKDVMPHAFGETLSEDDIDNLTAFLLEQ
jgi:cytochrome c oxidase subunit 2